MFDIRNLRQQNYISLSQPSIFMLLLSFTLFLYILYTPYALLGSLYIGSWVLKEN